MATNSGIAWTDHTFNSWWGCTKVAPACDFCYAEDHDRRFRGAHWGVGVPRRLTSQHNRNEPLRWQRAAERDGTRPRVFALSMGDWADNEVPAEWRADLWETIRLTPLLRWMLLTKRIGNAAKMLPPGFPNGYEHVGLMATIADQDEADRDIPKLLRLKARRNVTWVGISVEPMLGLIDPTKIEIVPSGRRAGIHLDALTGNCVESGLPYRLDWNGEGECPKGPGSHIDWVIIGGESGKRHEARDFVVDHARALMRQCQNAGTAVFVKQFGRNPILGGRRLDLRDAAGGDMDEWPEDLRVREFPEALRDLEVTSPQPALL